jgi:probable phosphoglycerate mutase
MSRHPLVFIRHGETDWNRMARFQGQRDVPLNAIGRRQAERNGRAVAGILASGEWRCVASPLGRAVETLRIALAAAGRSHQAFTTDPLLREASYGDWEGLTPAEIAALDSGVHERRALDKWGFVPPSGESYAQVSERVAEWLKTLDGPTLVVAHAGIMRGLLFRLAGLPARDAPHFSVPHDRVILFTRQWVLTI